MKSDNKNLFSAGISVAGISAVLAAVLVLSGCSKSKPNIPRETRTGGQTGIAPTPTPKTSPDLAKKKKETEEGDQVEDSEQPQDLVLDLVQDYVGTNLVLKAPSAEGEKSYQGYIVFGLSTGQPKEVGGTLSEASALYRGSQAKANEDQSGQIDPLTRQLTTKYSTRLGINTIGIAEKISANYFYTFIIPFDYRSGNPSRKIELKKAVEEELATRQSKLYGELGNGRYESNNLKLNAAALSDDDAAITLLGEDAKILHAQLSASSGKVRCESEAKCTVALNFRTGELIDP